MVQRNRSYLSSRDGGAFSAHAFRTTLRCCALLVLVALVTSVPQTVAALSDGPIVDEKRTVRSAKKLFFLDRTIASRFSLVAPNLLGSTFLTTHHTPPRRLAASERGSHLDAHAPPPGISWLMRILTVNLLHHSNYT